MKKYLIAVVGATAIGKTTKAIELAKHYNTEILSADSRQFFKQMKIGTAVPTKQELSQVKHHFIQHKNIQENYSVGDFQRDAKALLENLFKEKNVVVAVGGSGLYVDALTEELDDFPKIKPGLREELKQKLNDEGIEFLQEKLKELDPIYYQRVDTKNPHRMIRALEVCISAKKPYSGFLNGKKTKKEYRVITLGLKAEREVIYQRINQRVDRMIREGLIAEAQELIPYKKLNALQTVGYRELFDFFDKKTDLFQAIENIKANTRKFAKRQETWWRKKQEIVWVDYDQHPKEIIQKIENKMQENYTNC